MHKVPSAGAWLLGCPHKGQTPPWCHLPILPCCTLVPWYRADRVLGLSAGYEGVYCEINTDECASSPCLHNGNCLDKINEFHCECPTGTWIPSLHPLQHPWCWVPTRAVQSPKSWLYPLQSFSPAAVWDAHSKTMPWVASPYVEQVGDFFAIPVMG